MSESQSTRVHPTAVVHPSARIGPGSLIGPHAVIDADVVMGPECIVGPGVYITGHTVIGARNRFHAGAVVGDAPQDLKYDGGPTRLQIGDDNTFREHVTVHRSNKLSEDTTIGNGNLLMAGSHVGHNCHLGNNNILVNTALLAGHVVLADRVFVSGSCLVHQMCRIGRLALMQGGAAISRDLPPFCIARGNNGIAGLNVIGLRRAGVPPLERLKLRGAYHRLFRSRQPLQMGIADVRAGFPESALVAELVDFVAASRRGICRDSGSRSPRADAGGEDEHPL
jgi:UDP-N-acetylglucosamine acyltransferase